MRKYIATILLGLSLSLSAACGGDDASCDKVVDHTISLLPAEMKSQMGDKKALVEQCEKKTSKEERKCALGAKSMEDLMKCKKS
jgi:hypothetical protein